MYQFFKSASDRLHKICSDIAFLEGINWVLVVEPSGQVLASSGQTKKLNLTGLASLTASSMAATFAIARLMNEDHFSSLLHEGKNDKLLMHSLSERGIIAVNFKHEKSLGWLRFQLRKREAAIVMELDNILQCSTGFSSPLSQVSDKEIESLV